MKPLDSDLCRQVELEIISRLYKFSTTSEDIFRTVVSMTVKRDSIHSVSKQYHDVACETSLRYHLKKLNMEEVIRSNEKILIQSL
jgi:putative transposase